MLTKNRILVSLVKKEKDFFSKITPLLHCYKRDNISHEVAQRRLNTILGNLKPALTNNPNASFITNSVSSTAPTVSAIPSNSKCKFSNAELCYLSAVELLALFKKLEVSPVQVLQAQIERIEELNSTINALTFKHYEEAFQQARESEKRYREGNPRVLEGLTCAVKDDVFVQNWRSPMGSLINKDCQPATEDSAFAATIRATGVVMHIQTNVPEYYCSFVTWNKLFGTTRNPWNTAFTPGGSSGGASAALAAGFTTLATGSDMGGSIRCPATMTGLYGFKPPYGRVATSLVQYVSYGPLARNFKDLALFQNAISGPHPQVISSLRPKLEYPLEYGDIKGWKIAYDPMNNWGVPLDDTICKAMEEAISRLQSLGAIVEKVDLGFNSNVVDTFAFGLFSTSMGYFCFNDAEKHPELITPYMKTILNKYAKNISHQKLAEAEIWIDGQHNKIQKKVFLKDYKAIIMPTLVTPYLTAELGSKEEDLNVIINGKKYPAKSWDYSFTWLWNLLGQYPVMNVPTGITHDNIPLGMQIIGNTYDDLTLFQVAYNYSKIAPEMYQKLGMPTREQQKPFSNIK